MNNIEVPEVNITKSYEIVGNKLSYVIRITASVDEAAELLHWLDLVPTQTMEDTKYLFFINFKRRLQLVLEEKPGPVAEEDVTKAPIEKTVGHGDGVHEIRGGFPGED